MSAKPKLICPNCGAEMNHHANKVDYDTGDEIGGSVFGGVLKEVHTCPRCGKTELKAA